jgi:hypothetical protein
MKICRAQNASRRTQTRPRKKKSATYPRPLPLRSNKNLAQCRLSSIELLIDTAVSSAIVSDDRHMRKSTVQFGGALLRRRMQQPPRCFCFRRKPSFSPTSCSRLTVAGRYKMLRPSYQLRCRANRLFWGRTGPTAENCGSPRKSCGV